MPFSRLATIGLFAAGLCAAAPAAAQPGASIDPGPHPCFFVTQWQGWKAPSPNEILLKVNTNDIYRVVLSGGSSMLQAPGVHLVSEVRGSDSICSAIDLQLAVSDGHGMREPLIARSLTKLTPDEVAAIPPKYRP